MIAFAAVIVLLLGSITAVWLVSRDGDGNSPTAWDKVMSHIGKDGTVGLDMAKQAFVLAYAPLPHVERPQGAFGPARSTSDVASWILSHWDRLNEDERRIVAGALGLANDSKVSNGMRLVANAPPRLDGTCTKRMGLELKNAPDEFAMPVPGVKAELERLLGTKFDAAVTVCLTDSTVDEFGRNNLADTLGQYLADGSYRCRITLFPAGQAYQDKARLAIFAHELTHCLFRRIAEKRKDANGFVEIPPWVDEGLNQWVTYQLVGPTPDLSATLAGWISDPRKPVFERSYDALGFFGHAEQVQGGLAGRVKDIVGAAGDNYSLAAYQATLGTGAVAFLNAYPSSFADDVTRGPQWKVDMPGLGYYKPNIPTYYVKKDQDPVVAGSLPFGAGLVNLVFDADVVMVTATAGTDVAFGRFGPDPALDFSLADATRFMYCAKQGGCACPDGYTPDLGFAEIGVKGYLAVTGADKAAFIGVVGYSLDRFCKEKPKPKSVGNGPWEKAPGGGGGAGNQPKCQRACGGSTTDPHLNTFDNYFYDLQSVGEYTLTAAREGDLEVQARTAPVAGSTTASINVAFAVKNAGDRVGFYSGAGKLTVQVNGKPTEVKDGETALPGGGKLIRSGPSNYSLLWPDGTQIWVLPVQESLTVQVSPAESRKGKMLGLLGDFDGDQANDLKLRDGTAMKAPSFTDLHTTLVDSWRVTATTSLFDYAPGQSTDTFTNRALPTGPVSAENSPNRAAAEKACRDAGVTDPIQLNNCIIDVGVTGNAGYAAGAAAMQNFLAKAVGPGQTLRDRQTAGGTIAAAGQKDRFPLDLGGAKWFYITKWTGPTTGCDQALSISIVDVTHDHRPCTGGTLRLQVPDPKASYQLEIAGAGGKLGQYQFELITLKVRDFSINVGGQAQGNIDVPGRMDLYAVNAGGATKIRLTGTPECGAGLRYELINLDTGQIELSPRPLCRDIEIALPNPSTRYGIGITNNDLATGTYAFTVQTG